MAALVLVHVKLSVNGIRVTAPFLAGTAPKLTGTHLPRSLPAVCHCWGGRRAVPPWAVPPWAVAAVGGQRGFSGGSVPESCSGWD